METFEDNILQFVFKADIGLAVCIFVVVYLA